MDADKTMSPRAPPIEEGMLAPVVGRHEDAVLREKTVEEVVYETSSRVDTLATSVESLVEVLGDVSRVKRGGMESYKSVKSAWADEGPSAVREEDTGAYAVRTDDAGTVAVRVESRPVILKHVVGSVRPTTSHMQQWFKVKRPDNFAGRKEVRRHVEISAPTTFLQMASIAERIDQVTFLCWKRE